MSSKLFKVFTVLVITCFIPNISFSGDLILGKEIAATICSTCHGLDGKATTGGNSTITPNITAQQKDYLIAKLKDYKSLKIDHPQMSLIAQMLNDEDIENVSEWYSSITVEIKLPE
mgnify:FL=1